MQTSSRKEFSTVDAPITKVVVYRDRADISRVLRLTAAAGQQEVVLANIPTSIDAASLRVEGRGPAIVTEVNLSDTYVSKTHKPSSDQKEKSLRDAIEILEQQKVVDEHDEARLIKQQVFWNGCVDSLATNAFAVPAGKSSTASPASTEIHQSFSNFLDVHAKKSRELDHLLREKREVIKKVTEQIRVAQCNLNEHCYSNNSRQTWNIVVGLNVKADNGELELTISYIAYNARWSPKYDVRVSDAEKQLEINYYAIISQNTGEDWNNIPLCLSTASPSSGGDIPVLGTRQLSFKVPPPPPQIIFQEAPQPMKRAKKRTVQSRTMVCDEEVQECAEVVECSASMGMSYSTANVVQDSGITTTFEIAKQTSIPSDGSDHKVTVGVINLKPKIEYKSVPKKLQQAFLVAKAINSSQYPILPGPANIFFGSNFVASVNLKTVSPLEEFCCSLGVDPAVKVTYRPVRRLKEQSGVVSKTTAVSYVQEIEVNNTRPDPVHMVIVDQIPYSTEDSLVVTITDPALTKDKKAIDGFLLNKENNIEHEVDIKPRSVYTWTIKYKVEYPPDKEIEEAEVCGIENQ